MFDQARRGRARVRRTFVLVNVTLFLFNLIPLAPLDGNSVLNGIVGERVAAVLRPLQTYGPMILMGMFLLSSGFAPTELRHAF